MLRYFGQSSEPTQITLAEELVHGWIDLLSPSCDEEHEVEQLLNIDIPTHHDIKSIEPSSRLYREGDAVFAAAQVVIRGDSPKPRTMSVAFILREQALLTVRYEDSTVFDLFAAECERTPGTARSGVRGLIGLLEAIVDRTSELLETVGEAVDDLPERLHPVADGAGKRKDVAELQTVFAEIQVLHRRTAKVRESLVSLGRMVGFLITQPELNEPEVRLRAKSITRDILALSDHASFVAQNVQFVLDAALGLVGIEQNAIVKFFSIVAVVLLPPTLIAAIYGMNFKIMPELTWPFGYPLAILAMISSAVLPYFWCRRRGWL
ncbi:MAG: magnesium transporter CorA family protein [Chromatiales bacterium]|nr:magnesium transporter CorA family protein [Chromatiales bacterium]